MQAERQVVRARQVALALLSSFPLMTLALNINFATYGGYSTALLWPTVGTAVLLPLHAAAAREALLGRRRTARLRWLLSGELLVVAAVTPVANASWAANHSLVAFAAMVALAPWQAAAAFALLVALQFPLSAALDGSDLDGAFLAVALAKSLLMLALVRLVEGTAQLAADRAELRRRAVSSERLRLSVELAQHLGGDLAALTRRTAVLAAGRGKDVSAGLPAVTAQARDVLARARRVSAGYREPSLEAEVTTARALLSAAGLPVTLHVAPDLSEQAGGDTDRLRQDLRRQVGQMLSRAAPAGPVTLVVSLSDGVVILDAQRRQPVQARP